jgi:hypothetical protein
MQLHTAFMGQRLIIRWVGRQESHGRTAPVSEGTVVMLAPWLIVAGGLAIIGYRLLVYRMAGRRRRRRPGAGR